MELHWLEGNKKSNDSDKICIADIKVVREDELLLIVVGLDVS